jgi:hypothetical protein
MPLSIRPNPRQNPPCTMNSQSCTRVGDRAENALIFMLAAVYG